MNTIIIEDEQPAMELLVQTLLTIDPDIQINALLSSVKQGAEYMNTNPAADLILSDIQLSDGFSFEIFKHKAPEIPVVFITGYNDYMLNAFACNGIDYLLKPVDEQDLRNALQKYKMLEKHFSNNAPLEKLIQQFDQRKKSRLIVRRGMEYLALRLHDIALLYTENKLVYVIDKEGRKYLGDKTLGDMELELNSSAFFRANRKYIVNIEFIKGFRPFEKVKLLVELALPELHHEIIISQENAPHFRQWIYAA